MISPPELVALCPANGYYSDRFLVDVATENQGWHWYPSMVDRTDFGDRHR